MYKLKNKKQVLQICYMGKKVTLKNFEDKDFLEALSYYRVNYFSSKLQTKFPTVDSIKELFKEEDKKSFKEKVKAEGVIIKNVEFNPIKLNNSSSGPVIRRFTDNHFADALKYSTLPFQSIPTPSQITDEWKVEEVDTGKMKSMYTLYQGEKRLLTGYSSKDKVETTQKLVSCITGQKHLVIHGKDGLPIAFYNKEVMNELSFQIYSLE